MRRNQDGFIVSSEYFDYIIECLKENGPSVYIVIADCVYEKMKSYYKQEDTERHLGYRSQTVWEHQVSEALFTLKKKGIVRLRNDKKYEIV